MQKNEQVKKQWANIVLKLLKTELIKRDLNYIELQKKLMSLGVIESVETIRNKMTKGTFSAIFLIQCLRAIGVEVIRLDDAFFEK